MYVVHFLDARDVITLAIKVLLKMFSKVKKYIYPYSEVAGVEKSAILSSAGSQNSVPLLQPSGGARDHRYSGFEAGLQVGRSGIWAGEFYGHIGGFQLLWSRGSFGPKHHVVSCVQGQAFDGLTNASVSDDGELHSG